MTDVKIPELTGVIDQNFLIAPRGGAKASETYLDLFPDELYNKSIDSHLVALMYSLLGPAGIGWLQSNYFQARLALEEYGLSGFDLDKFYGNPLKFGRILEETYDQDPNGLTSRSEWDKIKTQDAAYRTRALDFITGARAGGTPTGMRLVARSGIGHEVEIFERYRWVYDQLTDDPIGIPDKGVTNSTEEMVIIPRKELPRNEIQVLRTQGNPTGGSIKLFFPVGDEGTNQTSDISCFASAITIQEFLEFIPKIGIGNVIVSGGPIPSDVTITFVGRLANSDVPKLQVINALTGTEIVTTRLETVQNGIASADEVSYLSPRDQRHLQSALSRIKPMTTLPTFSSGEGLRSAQVFNSVHASSQLSEVVRFVTGKTEIQWPTDQNHWIRSGEEVEAPRSLRHTALSYVGYHDPVQITSYTESALEDLKYLTAEWPSVAERYRSDHIGTFNPYQNALFPILAQKNLSDVTNSSKALASPAEPLTITSSTLSSPPVSLINGVYPQDYQALQSPSFAQSPKGGFWASMERQGGTEYLEIDLGAPEAVNLVTFEITKKPFDISVEYDVLDQAPRRSWAQITPGSSSTSEVGYQGGQENSWEQAQISISTPLGAPVITRFLRIGFTRRESQSSLFYNAKDGSFYPYSCEVRNLRVQRNVH